MVSLIHHHAMTDTLGQQSPQVASALQDEAAEADPRGALCLGTQTGWSGTSTRPTQPYCALVG